MSRENLQEILAALVPFAQQQLDDTGTCPPLAASLDGSGEIELHMPPLGEGGDTETFLDLLREALRAGAQAGHYEATGLCMEVAAQREGREAPTDALCVHLEAPGESLHFFVPYERGPEGSIAWGDTFFGPAEPEVFPSDVRA